MPHRSHRRSSTTPTAWFWRTDWPPAAPAGYPAPTPPNPSDVIHLIESDADSYVRDGAPNANFGTNTYMRCKDDPGGSYSRWSYLRFAVPNVRGTVERVVLRLKVVGVSGSGGTHTAYRVNDSWDETTITWSNRPTLGTQLASAAYAAVNGWTEFDITDAFDSDDAQLSVAVVSDGSALVNYASRESGPDSPQLVVQTYSPVGDDIGTGTVFMCKQSKRDR